MPFPIDTSGIIERSRGTSMREIQNSGMYGKVKGISGVSALATGESVQAIKSAAGTFSIDAPNELMLVGAATAPLTGVGIFLGVDGADYEFRAGDPAGNYLHWNGSTLTIVGSITATSGTIGGWTIGATTLTSGSGATSVGLDSGGTNPAFYAGSATPGSAPFRVTQAGALVAASATITGTITASSVVAATSFTAAVPVFTGQVTIQGGGSLIIDQSVDITATLSFRSPDTINTGLTTAPLYYDVLVSDFFVLGKAGSGSGGVMMQAMAEDGVFFPTFSLQAFGGQADTTKSTAGVGLFDFYATEHNGANALADITADGNVLSVRCRRGGADVALVLIDEDADMWVGGNIKALGTLVVGTQQTYSITNVTTDRAYDANATSLDEVADALGTLIADLRTIGLVL